MINGIVSPLCSVDGTTIVGLEWLSALESLSPNEPLTIRAGISADATDTIHLDAVKAGLAASWNTGHPVVLLAEVGISRYHELHAENRALLPNAPLGQGMNGEPNPTLNPYIDRASLALCNALAHIGDGHGIAGVIVGANEANILGLNMRPGDGPSPNAPSALAPEVFGAMLWQFASRVRALCPWVPVIYPAGFSCLVQFYRDLLQENPYYAGYWATVFDSLHANGKSAPWPWSGLNCHVEGVIAERLPGSQSTYADHIFAAMTQIKTQYGVTGPSVICEWGTQVQGMSTPAMSASYAKLQEYAALACFFQAGALTPNDPTGYGCWTWHVANGQFIPDQRTPWFDLLKTLYGGA